MFKKETISLLSVFFILSLTLSYRFILCKQENKISLRNIEKKISSFEDNHNERVETKQFRKGVRKDIFVVQDDVRLHYFLFSPSSELVFQKSKDKIELVERFSGCLGLMQERLYYDKNQARQIVKFLKTDEAIYHYHDHALTAKKANLKRYIVKGHHLPSFEVVDQEGLKQSQQMMSSDAENILFTLKNKKIDFKASRLRLRWKNADENVY